MRVFRYSMVSLVLVVTTVVLTAPRPAAAQVADVQFLGYTVAALHPGGPRDPVGERIAAALRSVMDIALGKRTPSRATRLPRFALPAEKRFLPKRLARGIASTSSGSLLFTCEVYAAATESWETAEADAMLSCTNCSTRDHQIFYASWGGSNRTLSTQTKPSGGQNAQAILHPLAAWPECGG